MPKGVGRDGMAKFGISFWIMVSLIFFYNSLIGYFGNSFGKHKNGNKFIPPFIMFAFRSIISLLFFWTWANVSQMEVLGISELRRCFTEYSDFFPGALDGEWSGITDEEWIEEEKTGRRMKV